jgi:hypothetical protein
VKGFVASFSPGLSFLRGIFQMRARVVNTGEVYGSELASPPQTPKGPFGCIETINVSFTIDAREILYFYPYFCSYSSGNNG